MKKLHLPLIKIWFEMTKSEIKTEDYREITPYWAKRFLLYQNDILTKNLTSLEIQELCDDLNNSFGDDEMLEYMFENWYLTFKTFSTNKMTLGYPKATDIKRIIEFEHAGIEIRTGKPEWGADPNKLYFVIRHGKKIKM